jgi:hypothetical protein
VATPRPLYSPERDPVPIVQEAGWSAGPVGTGAENLDPPPPPLAFDPRTVQPAASRYIDWVIPAHTNKTYRNEMLHAAYVLYVAVTVALIERDRLREVLFVEYASDVQ